MRHKDSVFLINMLPLIFIFIPIKGKFIMVDGEFYLY